MVALETLCYTKYLEGTKTSLVPLFEVVICLPCTVMLISTPGTLSFLGGHRSMAPHLASHSRRYVLELNVAPSIMYSRRPVWRLFELNRWFLIDRGPWDQIHDDDAQCRHIHSWAECNVAVSPFLIDARCRHIYSWSECNAARVTISHLFFFPVASTLQYRNVKCSPGNATGVRQLAQHTTKLMSLS